MFRLKKMKKLAGVPLPGDTKTWPSEILKAIVNQHPYIDASKVSLSFKDVDPESGAHGMISIAKKAAVPFSIRKNDSTGKNELDPLDVIFDGAKYQSFDESSFEDVMESEGVGNVVSKNKVDVPSGNKYIGDKTGDVTPLEWTSNPTGFGGKVSTASCGLLGKVVRTENDVAKLQSLMGSYSGVNSVLSAIGIGAPLERLTSGASESSKQRPDVFFVRRRGYSASEFYVTTPDDDTRVMGITDLKQALGVDFKSVIRQVNRAGFAVVTDIPENLSSDIQDISWDNVKFPVQNSGAYTLQTPGGEFSSDKFYVFSNCFDFDGQNLRGQQLAVSGSGQFSLAEKFFGEEINGINSDALDMLKFSEIDVNKKGIFVSEQWGVPTASRVFDVEQILDLPGLSDVAMVVRLDNGTRVGLVPIAGIIRCQPVRAELLSQYKGVLPAYSYYLPQHLSFVELSEPIVIPDYGSLKYSRPEVTVMKTANLYHIHGELEGGKRVDVRNLDLDRAVVKLASYGLEGPLLSKIIGIPNHKTLSLYGLREMAEKSQEKLASGIDLSEFKKHAEEAMKAVNEAATGGKIDGQIADAITSMQFVSDDTLSELVGSDNIFAECEDKLAKMLLASRQGEESIEENGVQKALKGIGTARRSLKKLSIELESNDAKT